MSSTERTLVHLVRHGEVHNPGKVLYGRLPGYRLSDLGRQMADRIGQVFTDPARQHDIAAVISSPLQRAVETATPLARTLGAEILTDERLIEAGNSFQGSTVGSDPAQLIQPQFLRRLWNPLRPSWGEPYAEIAERMREGIKGARDAARGREAVVVSHQLPIWTLRRSVEGQRLWHDPRSRQCALASVTTVTFEGDEPVAISYREPAADLAQAASASVGA